MFYAASFSTTRCWREAWPRWSCCARMLYGMLFWRRSLPLDRRTVMTLGLGLLSNVAIDRAALALGFLDDASFC